MSNESNFIIFRGSKRLGLRAEDLTSEKISMIFQVRAHTIYFTDDHNRVVLPGPDGLFRTFDLVDGGHYEVHGEGTANEGGSWQGANPAARFGFRRPSDASSSSLPVAIPAPRATGPKTMQRNILIAEVVNGRPEPIKTLAVKFTEFEASVPCIREKVSEALDQDQPVVLIDSHGNEIMDCDGTRGSVFWKQHARKIYAVPEDQLQGLRGKRRRDSRQEDRDLGEVGDNIEEVILASQGLQEVSSTLRDLVRFAVSNKRTTVSLSESQATAVKDAFTCIICRDPMRQPIVAGCCNSLLGCQACIRRWQEDHSYCPKCRAEDFEGNAVVGLDEALDALDTIISN